MRRCIAEGLVGGERFAVDASLVEADANKQRSTAREDWDPGVIDPDTAPRAPWSTAPWTASASTPSG